MDIESFNSAFALINNALSLFKKGKELLPNSPQKEALTKSLNEAEAAFKIAETQAAKELGYQICKCTWPPQIAISIGYENYQEKFKCNKCGRVLPPESPPLPPAPGYSFQQKD